MDYKHPFVLFLNVSVCAILLFLMLPSLLNKREVLKVRLAFSLIFFTVIVNCTTNVLILQLENYRMVPVVFMAFFIPLLFGPAVLYYVKSLLGSTVEKAIYLTIIPGVVSFIYGMLLAFADSVTKQDVLRQIIAGEHTFFNLTNVLTLIFIMVYCIKAWMFLRKLHLDVKDKFYLQTKLKKAWSKEFILYIFVPVFTFSILHALVVGQTVGVSVIDMDLIWMPVFMLIVYLLIAIRNMMMFKEYEHQFVLAKLEADKELQQQRLKISRDLHDSLGAQLTFSNSLLDSIRSSAATLDEKTYRKINTLSEFSQNSVSELKSVLWVLNTDEIHLQDLKARMLNLVKDAGDAHENMQIDFDFSFTENSLLSGKQAINLFRVVQEIINNSIKHANAREFSIEVKQAGDWLFLRIKDNGIGFDWEKEKNKSFGLSHIKDRVAEISGQLQVDTGATIGTVYQIKIPLQP